MTVRIRKKEVHHRERRIVVENYENNMINIRSAISIKSLLLHRFNSTWDS